MRNNKPKKQTPKPNQSVYNSFTAMAKNMFINAERNSKKGKKNNLWQQ